MKTIAQTLALAAALAGPTAALAQSHPAITSWLRNTTGVRGRHYVAGNSTPVQDTAHANVQVVRYSADNVYINASGVPAYVTGPFQDGNRALATNRNYLFRIPLNPQRQTGTQTSANRLGNLGIFINGVPMYNYLDGRSYNNAGIWRQNAIMFERLGFDCSKGHPSPVMTGGPPQPGQTVQGAYHHHQDPSAYNIARVPLSTVCNLYLADGLYVPDSTQHGPLIGFAFDGFPVYGGYGYADPNQPGAVKRIRSSYRLRAITERTTLPDGTVLQASQYGPSLATYALGYYGEDFEYAAGSGDLDASNGRFAVTPDYPQGTYAYYATIDADGNPEYPYLIGASYYGVVATDNYPAQGGTTPTQVTITGPVTTYNGIATALEAPATKARLTVFPSPAQEVIVVQTTVAAAHPRSVELIDLNGRTVARQTLEPGSTMCYFQTQGLYTGTYLVRVQGQTGPHTRVVVE